MPFVSTTSMQLNSPKPIAVVDSIRPHKIKVTLIQVIGESHVWMSSQQPHATTGWHPIRRPCICLESWLSFSIHNHSYNGCKASISYGPLRYTCEGCVSGAFIIPNHFESCATTRMRVCRQRLFRKARELIACQSHFGEVSA